LTEPTRVDPRYATDELRCDYAHVGLFDAEDWRQWIARPDLETDALSLTHAALLHGGSESRSVPEKDRFLCYWFHTPNTGEGYVHGYPIEWEEGHLLVRLDPNWDFENCRFIPSHEGSRVERNIEKQYAWGQSIFDAYVAKGPKFPLSWHMVGPRAMDSMFYIQRVEP